MEEPLVFVRDYVHGVEDGGGEEAAEDHHLPDVGNVPEEYVYGRKTERKAKYEDELHEQKVGEYENRNAYINLEEERRDDNEREEDGEFKECGDEGCEHGGERQDLTGKVYLPDYVGVVRYGVEALGGALGEEPPHEKSDDKKDGVRDIDEEPVGKEIAENDGEHDHYEKRIENGPEKTKDGIPVSQFQGRKGQSFCQVVGV